ncbi:MAG: hypothetical protein JXO44_06035 [Clostridia bacterium]|nr:hypothetical protein [Clostridia bacterium]
MTQHTIEPQVLIKMIETCQQGDEPLRNYLIKQYLPFIVKTTSAHLKRYVEIENNDELTIAMIAFDEAISKFDPLKGTFFAFAERVIITRLIDFQRTGDKEHTLSYDDPESAIAEHISDSNNLENEVVQQTDIENYEASLRNFGLSYDDLIVATPKHIKTRQTALSIGKRSSEEPPIVEKLYQAKRLPITKIATRFKITVKIIKRSKALITSVIIAYVEKFETITQWIDSALKDEDHV